MPEASPENISPAALAWARERALLSHAEVAKRLRRRSINAATIESWERGDAQPSAAQVRSLAQIFGVPARWLSYNTPPLAFDELGLVDFRTKDGRPLTTPSLNLRGAIEHALAMQTWAVDYRRRAGNAAVPLVGSCTQASGVASVAEHLRQALDVERVRAEASGADEFLKSLRQQLERVGLIVFRMGQVANKTAWSLDPEEFKGFTLIDEERLAPLVFVNRKDLEDAQLFTLGHELAHVATGGSGVSNEDIEHVDNDRPAIERFCDDVAEELLLPSEQFKAAWGKKKATFDEALAKEVGDKFKVSSLVAGRRAATLKRAPVPSFRSFVARCRESLSEKRRGGSVYVTMPAWYGENLVQTMASVATTGSPAAADALELLGVKYTTALRLAAPRRKQSTPTRMDRFPLLRLNDAWRRDGG